METDNPAVQAFALHLASKPLAGRRRMASDNTIGGYAQDLTRFAAWFEQSNPGKTFSAQMVTTEDIQDYVAFLRTVKHQKANSVLRQYASIRAFCRWAVASGVVQHDESEGIALPDSQKLAPSGLDRLQRRALRRALNTPTKSTAIAAVRNLRDRALVLVMMYVGLRISEIEAMRLPDLTLNGKGGEIGVRSGKGDKDRSAVVPKNALDALNEWLKARPAVEQDAVFVEMRAPHAPLGRRSIQQMLNDVGRRAGLDKDGVTLTPHLLRHTAVHIWRERGVDPFTIAAQMGHDDINTTMRYGRTTQNDLRRAAGQVSGEEEE